MTLQNITITTPNNTDLYFLKADGSDFIQAPISETTHIGVLRYAPTEAGLYQGEVYANASALKQYRKFPVALTVLNVLTVDVFVSITDPSDDPDYAGWFQVGKGLSVVGTSFGLLESDVPAGTDIWVMVKDSVNPGVYDIHTAHVYSTITLDTYPDHAEIDETFTVSGKADCAEVKITFSSATEEVSYVVSVVNGVYSKADCALATADGFAPFNAIDITVEDNADALSFVNVVDAMVIVPTMGIDVPIELVAGVQKAVTGTSNYIGQQVELESRLSDQDPEDSWTTEGFATVDEFGVWSINVTVASASTRDFRLIDYELDPAICSAQVDDVVVESGVTILSKLQIGTYFDTISQTTINAPNTVWGCVYNDAEEAFFVGGTTNKSNFYNSGTTLTGTNVQPFIIRLSKLGEVVWCKQFNADDETKSMCLNPIFARNGKVVLTFRISSNNRRRTFSVNYDGTGTTLSTDNGIVGLGLAEVGYLSSGNIGVVIGIGTFSGASNRAYKSYINSEGWILSPASSPINISSRTFGTSQLRGVISNNIIYYTGTQLTSDSPSKNAEVYTYNLANGTTSIAFTQAFSENSPVPHAVLSDKAIYSENSDWVTNIENNRVMVTATAKTTIPDSPRKFSVFMFEDSASLLFIGGNKGITGRNPVTYERLWLKDIDTIDNTAVITDCRLATTVDDEYILMSGRTTGNFDGNNPGNTTLNGILYVIKKTGEDL